MVVGSMSSPRLAMSFRASRFMRPQSTVPMAVSGIAFYLIYVIIPHRRVSHVHAAIGAVVAERPADDLAALPARALG